VLIAALIVAAGCSNSTGTIGPKALGKLPDTPVLFLHGYNPRACPGTDVTHVVWGGAYAVLTKAGWPGPLLPISYYACDSNGVDITGYGSTSPAGATPTITAGTPRTHYDQNTSIDQLAHDLAWFVYNTYTRKDTPVDLVASSMGGLIARDLLYRVAQHDQNFPPKVLVTHVVTFSTPYKGYGGTGSSSICPVETVQCDQFAVGSPLMTQLNSSAQPPQGDGGTTWSAAGSSSGCDLVPTSSSLALPDSERVDYHLPCYAHTAYLYDGDAALDAVAQITQPDGSTTLTEVAQHSLSWMVTTLAGK
jgi:pimeloyl-ACP methyl ester carboxylesterase